ncbi:MAG: hypothetical protein RIK87_09095 [Fuerstiella sp.]
MQEFLNQTVVIDVESLFVFVGTLTDISEQTVTLRDVDVHDLRDSKTTRERYVLDSRRDGVRVNRRRVQILRQQVVSISALEDVLE